MYYPKKSYLTLRLDINKLQQGLQPGASPALQKEYRAAFGAQFLAFPRIREIFETANRDLGEQERRAALLRLLSRMILEDILEYEISKSEKWSLSDKQSIEEIKKKLHLVGSSNGPLGSDLILTNRECECINRLQNGLGVDGQIPMTYYQAIIQFGGESICDCLMAVNDSINQKKQQLSEIEYIRGNRYSGLRPFSIEEGQDYLSNFPPSLIPAARWVNEQDVFHLSGNYLSSNSYCSYFISKKAKSINHDPIDRSTLQQTYFWDAYTYGASDPRITMRLPVAMSSSILTVKDIGKESTATSPYFFNMEYTFALFEIFDPELAEKITAEARLSTLIKTRRELPLVQLERDIVASVVKKYSKNGVLDTRAVARAVNQGGTSEDDLLMLAYSDDEFARKLIHPSLRDEEFKKLNKRFLVGGYAAIDKKVLLKRLGLRSSYHVAPSDDLDNDEYMSQLASKIDEVNKQEKQVPLPEEDRLIISLKNEPVVTQLLSKDPNTIFSVLTGLEPSRANVLIRYTPILSHLSSPQLTALITRSQLPVSFLGMLESQVELAESMEASKVLARHVLSLSPPEEMTFSSLRERFDYYRNHPAHNLTQDDLIEISRKHPWLWIQGQLFDQSSWLQRTFDWKWLGRLVSGTAWRERMTSDTIAKMLQDKTHPARAYIANAMVRDSSFSKRVLSSNVVKNNPSLLATIVVLLNLEQATLKHQVTDYDKPIIDSLKGINGRNRGQLHGLVQSKANTIEKVSPLFETVKSLRQQIKHTLLGDGKYTLAPDGLTYAIAIIEELTKITDQLPSSLSILDREKQAILVAELTDLWLLSPEVRSEVSKHPFILELIIKDEEVLTYLNSEPLDASLFKEATPECIVNIFTAVPQYRSYILEAQANKLVQSKTSLTALSSLFIKQITLATAEFGKIAFTASSQLYIRYDLNHHRNNINTLRSILTSQRQLFGALGGNDDVDPGVFSRFISDTSPNQLLDILITQRALHKTLVDKSVWISSDYKEEKDTLNELVNIAGKTVRDCDGFIEKILESADANRVISTLLVDNDRFDGIVHSCIARPNLMRRIIAEASYENLYKLLNLYPMLAPLYAEVYIANPMARRTMLKLPLFNWIVGEARQAPAKQCHSTKLFLAIVNHLLSASGRNIALLSRMRTVENVENFPNMPELREVDPFDARMIDRIPVTIKNSQLQYFIMLTSKGQIEYCNYEDNLNSLINTANKFDADGSSILFRAFPEVAYILLDKILNNKSDITKEPFTTLTLQAVRVIDAYGLSILFNAFPDNAYLILKLILEAGYNIKADPYNTVVRQALRVVNKPNELLDLCRKFPDLLLHVVANDNPRAVKETPLLQKLLSVGAPFSIVSLTINKSTRDILVKHMKVSDWDRVLREFLDPAKSTNVAGIDLARLYVDLSNHRNKDGESDLSLLKANKALQERMVIVFPGILDAMLLGSSPALINDMLRANQDLMPLMLLRLRVLYDNTETMKALVHSYAPLTGFIRHEVSSRGLTAIFTREPKNSDLLLITLLSNESFVTRLLNGFNNREALLFFRLPENQVFTQQIFKYPSVQQAYREYIARLTNRELVAAYFGDKEAPALATAKVDICANEEYRNRVLNNASVEQLTAIVINEPKASPMVTAILCSKEFSLRLLNGLNNQEILNFLGNPKNQFYVDQLLKNGALQQNFANVNHEKLTEIFEGQPIGSPILSAILGTAEAALKLLDEFKNTRVLQHLVQLDEASSNSPLVKFVEKKCGKDLNTLLINQLFQHAVISQAFLRHKFFSDELPFDNCSRTHCIQKSFCVHVFSSGRLTPQMKQEYVNSNPWIRSSVDVFAVDSKARAAQLRSGLLKAAPRSSVSPHSTNNREALNRLPLQPISKEVVVDGP